LELYSLLHITEYWVLCLKSFGQCCKCFN